MNKIRIMKPGDLEAVNEIYNQAVESKFSTAHTHPVTMKERLDWANNHDPLLYPVFVYKEAGKVAGWIAFSPYRESREALQTTAEISYYVHTSFHRRGIGSRLMEHALYIAPSLNFNALIAILLEPNTASIALLKKFGFTLWGDMPGLAEIDGQWYNHQYYGLHLLNPS